jgi:hexosaminidase
MSASHEPLFRLETLWSPATDTEQAAYTLTLTNVSADPLSEFRLCVSGPSRVDPNAAFEGGSLVERLSNHAEFAPPMGFVLKPDSSWTVTAKGAGIRLRHWTDGATGAYLAVADGATIPVAVKPTQARGDNAPLKRGAEIFPVPERAPVPISVIPWPQKVAVSGRRSVPVGLALLAKHNDAKAAAEAFADLTRSLFPVEGIVRAPAEGGFPVSLSIRSDFGREAYAIRFVQDSVELKAGTRTGLLYGRADYARTDPARSSPPPGDVSLSFVWRDSR